MGEESSMANKLPPSPILQKRQTYVVCASMSVHTCTYIHVHNCILVTPHHGSLNSHVCTSVQYTYVCSGAAL